MANPTDPPDNSDQDSMRWMDDPSALDSYDPYIPTDPRASRNLPTGGMRIGQWFPFTLLRDMERLEAYAIAEACDAIVQSRDCYSHLLYLSRATPEDATALFDATQSHEIRERWDRLWVLSPYFAKVSRDPKGKEALLECMRNDLAAIHLLSKFIEQKNPSVDRLFKRLHDDLLQILLTNLRDHRDDLRRTQLLTGIIAAFETEESVLREALAQAVGEAEVEGMLDFLMVRRSQKGTQLSSEVLRDNLHRWIRD